MSKFKCIALGFLVALAFAGAGYGHLDTLMQVLEGPEVVKVFEAEGLPGIPPDRIIDDAKATGGKAVIASVDNPVFELDLGNLDIGAYSIYVVGRITGEDAFVGAVKNIRKPLYLKMDINAGVQGKPETHILYAPYETEYEWMSRIYFNAPERRNYR